MWYNDMGLGQGLDMALGQGLSAQQGSCTLQGNSMRSQIDLNSYYRAEQIRQAKFLKYIDSMLPEAIFPDVQKNVASGNKLLLLCEDL
jgi:hypothetical protein